MAIGSAYATVEQYRAHIGDSAGYPDDEMVLMAVSRLIDRKLDRKAGFNKDAAATVRIYTAPSKKPSRSDWAESENPWLYGNAARVIDVDDLVSVTTIKLDENRTGSFTTTLSATDYELLPLNASKGPEPAPYTQIGMTEWGNYGSWTPGVRIEVTGVHGWPAVPQAIKVATIQLAAMVQVKSVFATGRISELDQVVDASPQARAIIRDLMTVYNGGIFF